MLKMPIPIVPVGFVMCNLAWSVKQCPEGPISPRLESLPSAKEGLSHHSAVIVRTQDNPDIGPLETIDRWPSYIGL